MPVLSAVCRDEDDRVGGVDGAQADLEARLVAREKELRALAAEKGVLSQQARAAWALLDERSAAAHELEVAPPEGPSYAACCQPCKNRCWCALYCTLRQDSDLKMPVFWLGWKPSRLLCRKRLCSPLMLTEETLYCKAG